MLRINDTTPTVSKQDGWVADISLQVKGKGKRRKGQELCFTLWLEMWKSQQDSVLGSIARLFVSSHFSVLSTFDNNECFKIWMAPIQIAATFKMTHFEVGKHGETRNDYCWHSSWKMGQMLFSRPPASVVWQSYLRFNDKYKLLLWLSIDYKGFGGKPGNSLDRKRPLRCREKRGWNRQSREKGEREMPPTHVVVITASWKWWRKSDMLRGVGVRASRPPDLGRWRWVFLPFEDVLMRRIVSRPHLAARACRGKKSHTRCTRVGPVDKKELGFV